MLGSYALLTGQIADAHEHITAAIAASGVTSVDDRPEHVPLVLVPVVAGMIAALRGERDAAIEHTDRRAAAWLAQRTEVDASAPFDLAFNRALVRAMLDEPDGIAVELRDVVRTEVGGFVGHQAATCDLLAAWAAARLGDGEGLAAAREALARADASDERVLGPTLWALVADAAIAVGDPVALELLASAEERARSRGEVFWLAEVLRLRAVADRRFADGSRAAELLDEAESLASRQGANLLVERTLPSRAASNV